MMRFVQKKRRPGRASVKESMDNLPMGVCFADHRGIVLLLNRRMSRLSHAVTGQDLQDPEAFWQTVTEGTLAGGAVRLGYGSGPTIRLDDGTVWAFSRRMLTLDGRPVTQFLASDITELERTRQQLWEANRSLKAMNDRLKQYGKDVIEVTAREERLATKVRIHDELGGTLLATRHYLLSSGQEDAAPILEKWRRDIRLLRGSAEAPAPTSASVLANAAKALGVGLRIEGELPRDKSAETLLLSTVSEALNNAVRHAGASELRVVLTRGGGALTAVITNNGVLPAEEITEGGGLSGLRRSLEGAGGALRIAARPLFTLTAVIPECQ